MADILLCSADSEDIRFVVPALEQLGHRVHVECANGQSLAALPLARYDAIVIDLTSNELPEGELLNAARVLHDREPPGLLVVGVPARRPTRLAPQSRIVVLSAPLIPSQVVDALAPVHGERQHPASVAGGLARRIQARYNVRDG